MKLPYVEGTWFAVPLRKDGAFAAGVVARATKRGRVLLCYFFGPYFEIPEIEDVGALQAQNAALAVRVGDLHLIEGKWPIVGLVPTWRREQWPMPLFVRREILTGRIWLVYRSDVDPKKINKEKLLSTPPLDDIRHDSLYGAGAVEIVLTKLLAPTTPSATC